MTGFTVQRPAKGLEVVHAIPGRVRVRAGGSKLAATLEKLAEYLADIEGICQTNVNQQTGSLLVTFDESKLLLEQMLLLLSRYGVATPGELPQTAPQTELWAPVSAALEAAQLDSFVSLIVGMSIAQQLGIYGLPAIPVYLIAANTTRQVIELLELELPLFQGVAVSSLSGESISDSLSSTQQSPLYRLVHGVPGRMRFQIGRLASDPAYSRRLERLIESVSEITSVRINSAAASLVVAYKKAAVSEQAMRSRLVELIEQASVAAVPNVSTQLPVIRANNAVALTSEWHAHRPSSNVKHSGTVIEETATGISEKAIAAVAKNGHRPLSEIPTVTLEQTASPVAATRRAIAPISPQTPAQFARKKISVWDEYKPPALSLFLNFMANLY